MQIITHGFAGISVKILPHHKHLQIPPPCFVFRFVHMVTMLKTIPKRVFLNVLMVTLTTIVNIALVFALMIQRLMVIHMIILVFSNVSLANSVKIFQTYVWASAQQLLIIMAIQIMEDVYFFAHKVLMPKMTVGYANKSALTANLQTI